MPYSLLFSTAKVQSISISTKEIGEKLSQVDFEQRTA